MTVRDRAANAYRENYNFYEEDYQGDPCKGVISKKRRNDQQMCQWRLKPHAA
jgi:hypothetical protein